MAIPALIDNDIDRDSALKQLVMKAGLRDRDRWLWQAATGAGINPNVLAFIAKLLDHKHDGSAGHGDPIPTAGIASNAVNDSAMMGTNSVSAGKIAGTTMDTSNFPNGACTEPKLHNTMGQHLTGSSLFNTGSAPLGGDVAFKGDRKSIGHSKGTVGVVTSLLVGNIAGTDIPYFIASVSSSAVIFGLRDNGALPAGDNTWAIDAYIM